jgi:uncharacterized protein (DUF1330 family)
MPAFIIASVQVTNPDGYQEYSAQVPATLEKHGGRFDVRGGTLEPLEGGDWFTPRLVVLEFPDREAARRWYESDEYQRILPIRQANSTGKLVLVEGYEPPR